MRRPGFIYGERYRDLVGYTASYWPGLALALVDGPAESTLHLWMRRARQGDPPYRAWVARFRHDVARHRALQAYVLAHGVRPPWAAAFDAALVAYGPEPEGEANGDV